jgi:hypothetical protein
MFLPRIQKKRKSEIRSAARTTACVTSLDQARDERGWARLASAISR